MNFLTRIVQVCEYIKHNGLASFLHEVCYLNREAIVVKKNLIEYDSCAKAPENSLVRVIELCPDTFQKYLSYSVKNRHLKAIQYLKKGYGGYAIIKDEKIIGDIWFVLPKDKNIPLWHSDCELFRITCAHDQVYMFDMFLAPDERGNNLAFLLQSSALKALRQKGFSVAYGYYWGDNMPALWVHRLGKWKEVKRLKVNRFLFFKKVMIDQDELEYFSGSNRF